MKKTDSYNKYVPLFIDNYAEQRSAKLRARMGWAGYGIYLAILQRLRSEKECVLELDYESLAFSFWTDEETLRTIIEDFGLFTINRKKGCFFSPLLDEMLLSIDPTLAKARNKKKGIEYPANEELASRFSASAAENGCKVSEKGVQVPTNEELASCFSANAAENGCKVAEKGVQVPANEELASCFAADAQEGDCEVSKSSVQVPANEELASSSHACVRVNKQSRERREKKNIFSPRHQERGG